MPLLLSVCLTGMSLSISLVLCVRVQLEGEGTYECSVTGLVFEVSGRVLIRYSVLSWSKFGMFLGDSWRFAGPIFNVDCVNSPSSILTSIQFPHSLCLADPDSEMTFSVLHMKDSCPVIEPSVDHSGSHVKWRVSSLSPVGPIVQSSKPVEHHGVVLVYKELALNNSYSFRIYLATNNSSDIKVRGTRGVCVDHYSNILLIQSKEVNMIRGIVMPTGLTSWHSDSHCGLY